jgi:hypothetical protein
MASGSLEIWGGKWDSYAKGTHPFPKLKIPPGGLDGPIAAYAPSLVRRRA